MRCKIGTRKGQLAGTGVVSEGMAGTSLEQELSSEKLCL